MGFHFVSDALAVKNASQSTRFFGCLPSYESFLFPIFVEDFWPGWAVLVDRALLVGGDEGLFDAVTVVLESLMVVVGGRDGVAP